MFDFCAGPAWNAPWVDTMAFERKRSCHGQSETREHCKAELQLELGWHVLHDYIWSPRTTKIMTNLGRHWSFLTKFATAQDVSLNMYLSSSSNITEQFVHGRKGIAVEVQHCGPRQWPLLTGCQCKRQLVFHCLVEWASGKSQRNEKEHKSRCEARL